MNSFETFVQLHRQPAPFLLGNCWDVQSARLFEASGFQAVGTSSLAVAQALGYEDGEKLPFATLLQLAKRVTGAVHIPFSVDLEGGYSRTVPGIIENIQRLYDAGVVGINLEDSIAGAGRQLQPVADFEKILTAVADHISQNNLHLFLNIRTDGYLLGMPTAFDETQSRIKRYQNAGADGIFIPCITNKQDIRELVRTTSLPVNVMCMPELPDFAQLEALGVKRISMGSFFFNKVYGHIGELAKAIGSDKNFSSIL